MCVKVNVISARLVIVSVKCEYQYNNCANCELQRAECVSVAIVLIVSFRELSVSVWQLC